MVAAGREQDFTDGRPVSLLGDPHGQRRRPRSATSAMPAANCSSTCCTMTTAAGKSFGQTAQQRGQHRRAAGRGADRDQPIVAMRRRRRVGGIGRAPPAALVADQPRDRGDLGQQRPRRRPRSSPLPSSGVSTASSAPWPIASKTRLALTRTLPVTIRIAHGVLAMMRRVVSTPSMPGIDHVHQDQVRRLLRAELQRLGAAQRDPDDADWPGSTPTTRCRSSATAAHVVDDADSHASGSPIRSTTACSSVSS